MKDRSLLLLLLSVGLIATWAYHLYDKSQYYSDKSVRIQEVDSAAIIKAYQDSLSRSGNETGVGPGLANRNMDSLQSQLELRMKEINALKKSAGNILKNKNISEDDLKQARSMIRNLKLHIDEMKQQNTSLEDERIALSGELAKLNLEIDSLQQNVQKLGSENQQLSKIINDASIFIASEVKLSAVKTGAKEIQTSSSRRADKLIISFNVQNNIKNYPNAELVIVIFDPMGNVIMDDVWQSRTFNTKAEGTKDFTRKMKFDYNKGESKNLIFSLSPEKLEKGTYQLLIYHNGVKVGYTTLGLT